MRTPIGTDREAHGIVAGCLELIRALDRSGWSVASWRRNARQSARMLARIRGKVPRAERATLDGMVANFRTAGSRPTQEVRQMLAALERIKRWMEQVADGLDAEVPLEGFRVSLLTRPGPGQRVTLSLPAGYEPTRANYLEALVGAALDRIAVSRCPRAGAPSCQGIFLGMLGRGRPKSYCSPACEQAARTQRWRRAHREEFQAQRRAAYRARQKKRGPRGRGQGPMSRRGPQPGS